MKQVRCIEGLKMPYKWRCDACGSEPGQPCAMKMATENKKMRAELDMVKMWLDDALCIVRAMFDTDGPDDALVKAINGYLEGERRRSNDPGQPMRNP